MRQPILALALVLALPLGASARGLDFSRHSAFAVAPPAAAPNEAPREGTAARASTPHAAGRFEFKPIAFSGSVLRDGVPSAFGLARGEAAATATHLKIKPPKSLADKTADFDEAEFGFGLPVPGLYLRGRMSETDIEGATRTWKVQSEEYNLGWRIPRWRTPNAVVSIEAGRRTIDPKPIYIKGNPLPSATFFQEPTIDSVRLLRTSSHGENWFRHWMVGASRAEHDVIRRDSTFAGFGLDRTVGKRLDLSGSAVYIDSEGRPKNAYLGGRASYRIARGLNVSLEGGMFTNGYTYAPFRFADHFVSALAFDPAILPDSLRKFESKPFGFYGIGVHYGVKF